MVSEVAIAILAAGRSTRMGSFNKLLSHFGGVPLVRLSVARAVACQGCPVIVVTGHMATEITDEIGELPARIVHNSSYASGLSSSIRAALQAVPATCDGVLIHLADMPLINENHLSSMIEIFRENRGLSVVRAMATGQPGNPVILPRILFRSLDQLEGDTGARKVIAASGLDVVGVEIGLAAVCDIDTPEALDAAGGSEPRA